MDVFIKELGYYLPETVLSNEQIAAEFPEWTAQSIFDKVGIKNRRRAGDGETASDMAVKAAEELFRRAPNLKSTIDFILFCTQSPDYKLPTSACIIQHRLGLSETCGALDFNLGCSALVAQVMFTVWLLQKVWFLAVWQKMFFCLLEKLIQST